MKGVTKWKLLTKFVIALAILFIGSAVSLRNTSAVDPSMYWKQANVGRVGTNGSVTYRTVELNNTSTVWSSNTKDKIIVNFLMYPNITAGNYAGLKFNHVAVSFYTNASPSQTSFNKYPSPCSHIKVGGLSNMTNYVVSNCGFTARTGDTGLTTYTIYGDVLVYTSKIVTVPQHDLWFRFGGSGSSDFLWSLSPEQGSAFVTFNVFSYSSLEYITDSTDAAVSDINSTLNDMQQQDQQDREDLQNASDDADVSADSSGEQAESTGSTLLQAFTSFVGALTSASASDCTINFNVMGYINGGNVDLCRLNLPPAFQAISSLVLIGFCVPLSIATARKMINLFRSFQS